MNLQVALLIDVLGASGAGRRAIVKAIAEQQGVYDEDEVARIYNGCSDKKLRVPRTWRRAIESIGLGDILAPLNIVTVRDSDSSVYIADDAWTDIEFEVALD